MLVAAMTLDEMAVYWHELNASFVRAGFSSEDALSLTQTQMWINAQLGFMAAYYRQG